MTDERAGVCGAGGRSAASVPSQQATRATPSTTITHPFRLLRVTRSRVVYVESIARTESLSLTGKILYHARLADLFFVQWPGLAQRLPRAVYAGRLF